MNMQNEMIPLTVANTLDQSLKQRVEVPQNISLKQAIQEMKLAPKGQFDIYDAMGSVISNNNVAQHRDSTVYVGVAKVAGGAGGIPRERLKELKVEYPSIRPIRIHTNATHTAMVSLQFPSKGQTSNGYWQIAIHCPNASAGLPHAYLINSEQITGRPRVSIFSGNVPGAGYGLGASNTLPGTNKQSHWICHGNILPHLDNLGRDPIRRIGAYINHIQNLLNA